MQSFEEVFAAVRSQGSARIAVASAGDEPVLEAIKEAVSLGLATAELYGDAGVIRSIGERIGLDMEQVEIVDVPDPIKAAQEAVRSVHEGRSQVLMKGLIGSADFLRAVLNKEWGLRTGSTLSSVAVLRPERLGRFLVMTDGGMVMYPDIKEKVQLIANAVPVCNALGITNPKVAAICAVEVVNPAMQATVDAAMLSMMYQRGQIKGAIVDGPLAIDNAISAEAARHKGISGPVAGQADVLLMPNIEVGNAFYKALVYTADVETAALIMGAAAPIIMTSRSDSAEAKLNSIAVAALAARPCK